MILKRATSLWISVFSTAALVNLPVLAQDQPQSPNRHSESADLVQSSSLLGEPILPSATPFSNGIAQPSIVIDDTKLNVSPARSQRQYSPPPARFFQFTERQNPTGATFKINVD